MEDKIRMDYFKVVGLCIIALGVAIGSNRISKSIQELSPNIEYKLQERNVTGNNTPDKFYEINGTRAYTEVDDIPIEQYMREQH